MKTLLFKIPPIVTIIILVCMWVTAKLLTAFAIVLPLRELLASILSIAGGIISFLGMLSFKLAKTTINSIRLESVSSLVVSGIYSVTRNPMYLGLVFVLLGWCYFLSNILTLAFVPLYVLYINYFQIQPEEKVLESKFGESYLQYKLKVRRWL
jgi:protein-S-isoprenylcysteine O-methyltransferase Ste14